MLGLVRTDLYGVNILYSSKVFESLVVLLDYYLLCNSNNIDKVCFGRYIFQGLFVIVMCSYSVRLLIQ